MRKQARIITADFGPLVVSNSCEMKLLTMVKPII